MSFKTLEGYKKGFDLAMDVYQVSKSFPKEETFSLTDQIRRSSRSVCANISEAYRKRRYVKNWIRQLTDSDGENTETQVWLDFAKACNYISDDHFNQLTERSEEVGRLLNYMINNPGKFEVKEN